MNREEKREEIKTSLHKLVIKIVCVDEITTPKDCNDVFESTLDQAYQYGLQQGKDEKVREVIERLRFCQEEQERQFGISFESGVLDGIASYFEEMLGE